MTLVGTQILSLETDLTRSSQPDGTTVYAGTIANLNTEQAAHRSTTRSWASSPTCEPATTPSALTTPDVYPNVKT
jgi:hypothetical protein